MICLPIIDESMEIRKKRTIPKMFKMTSVEAGANLVQDS
jgi:hypothetical protein